MVQVDVFWSYGIGAGFAVANTWQLKAQERVKKSVFEHVSFRDAVVFLACLFVPSGAFLIWQFPSWETMHVGTRDLPGWLVAAFTMTNATQGMLGFAVAAALLRRQHPYAAYMQWVLGYFGMLFILVHGWDGTGYMRFLSSTRADFDTWTWATAWRWFTGDVARSLMIMGSVMIPVMFALMARDLKRGYQVSDQVRSDDAARVSGVGLALSFLFTVLGSVLGAAVLASVSIRYFGALLGIPIFAAVIYLIGLRRGGVFARHFRYMVYAEPLVGTTVSNIPIGRRPVVS
jgi:hypothetical protein